MNIAQAMIEELGADPTIRNHEGLTAAERIREDGDFEEVAEYLEGVTPGIQRSGEAEGAGPLAYAEFRSDNEVEADESAGDGMQVDVALNGDVGRRIDEIIRSEREDGVNRDEALRELLRDSLMRAVERDRDSSGNGNNAANRRRPDNP